MKNIFKGFDYTLIITPLLLASFGLIMIYSASMVSTVVDGLESTFYLKRQLFWFVLSLLGFILTALYPYQKYKEITFWIVLVSFGLLIFVLFFGDTVNRATRAISIFGLNLQPAEFIKLTLIIYLASIYSKKQQYIDNFVYGVLPPLVLMLMMIFLIVLQPDIGTAVIILLIGSTIILSSGIRFKHIMGLLLFAGASLLLLIPKLITDTRIARVTGAYSPFQEPDSTGYHLIQSYIAISGGGVKGEGLGQSVQKLGYLWGAHTDFIMAVIAEELGVFGVLIAIGLFAIITLRGLYIAKKSKDSFGSLLAVGISCMVAIQAAINLGAISGLLPITGVPLPFLSYGGSSLFVLMLAMGILNNIAKSVKMEEEKPTTEETEPINQYGYGRGRTWQM